MNVRNKSQRAPSFACAVFLLNRPLALMEYAQAALNLAAKSRFLGNITSDIVWLQQETVTLPDGTQTVALVPISIWFPSPATPDKTLRPMFYKPKRQHKTAGDISPVEFEKRYFQRIGSV